KGHQLVGKQSAHTVSQGVSTVLRAIGVQPQEREGPGARRREVFDGGQRRLEECGCPSATRWIGVLACAFGQCPKRSAMAIFRSLVFEPVALIAHEVSEPTGVWVPCVLDKGRKASS